MSFRKVKKLIALLLVITLIFSNVGFATLADSIDDVVSTTTQSIEKTKNYVADTDDNGENIIKEDDDSEDDSTSFATSSESDDDADDTDSGNLADEPEDEDGTDTATISDAEEEEKINVNTGDEAEEDEDTATNSDVEENKNAGDEVEENDGTDTATISDAEENKNTGDEVEDDEKTDDITASDSNITINDLKPIVSTISEDETIFGDPPAVTGTKIGEYEIKVYNNANIFEYSHREDPITGQALQTTGHGTINLTGNWYEALNFTMPKNQITAIHFSECPSTVNADEYVELTVDTSVTKPSYFNALLRNYSGYIARQGTVINVYYSFMEWYGENISGTEVTVYGLRLMYTPMYGQTNIDSFFDGFENLTIIDCDVELTPLLVDEVTSCKYLFRNCKNLRSIPNLSGYYAECIYMESMFEGCESLIALPTDNPFTSNIPRLRSSKNMFKGCKSLTSAIVFVRIDADSDFESMFEDCENIPSVEIGLQDVYGPSGGSRSLKYMFKNCKNLTQVTFNGAWWRVNQCEEMFYNCEKLTSVNLKDMSFGSIGSTNRMFAGCASLSTISINEVVDSISTSGTDMFKGCISLVGGAGFNYYDKNIVGNEFARTDHGGISPGYFTCNNPMSIGSIDVNFDTDWFARYSPGISKASFSSIRFVDSNNMGKTKKQFRIGASRVGLSYQPCFAYLGDGDELLIHTYKAKIKLPANFSGAFKDFTNATEITGLEMCDASAVQDVSSLFENDKELVSWTYPATWITVNYTNTSKMFYNCSKITQINGLMDMRTSNVTDMSYMFASCSELTSLNLNNYSGTWNFGFLAALDMSYMFAGCSKLQSLGTVFNFYSGNTQTPVVTNLSHMFAGCKNLPGINTIVGRMHVNNVTDTSSMFEGCSRLNSTNNFSWTTNNLTNASAMFKDCTNLPSFNCYSFNTGNIRNMSEMFSGCNILTTVQNLTFNQARNTKEMFKDCTSLTTINLGSSGLSNLQDGTSMFEGCSALTTITVDNNVRRLPVAAIKTDVFKGCTSLEGSNGTKYNDDKTSGIYFSVDYGAICPGYLTCSDDYFYNNVRFNLPSDWDVGPYGKANIKKISIFKSNDVGHYDSVCTISEADRLYSYIDGDTLKINYGNSFTKIKPSNIKGFFKGFTGVTEIEGLDEIDFTTTNDLSSLFENMSSITDINFHDINMQNIQNFSKMFKGCTSLTNLDFKKWTTTNATNMSEMFSDCNSLFYIVVSTDALGNCNFNTNLVTQSSDMFNNCTRLVGEEETSYETFGNRDKSFAVIDEGPTSANPGYLSPVYNYIEDGWYTGMSVPANQLTKISFLKYPTPEPTYDEMYEIIPGKLRSYRTGTEVTIYSVDGSEIGAPANSSYLFSSENVENQFSSLTTIDNFNLFRTKRAINISHMFEGTKLSSIDLSVVNLSRISNLSYMFKDAKDLTSITFGPAFDTRNITDMSYMFDGCERLNTIDLSNFNTANVINMEHMFSRSGVDTITLPATFTTNNVRSMGYMFASCSNLDSINANQLNVENVATMSHMFYNCPQLTNLNISNFNTSNAHSMDNMFALCSNLQNLTFGGNFNTENVTDLSDMFNGCERLTNISNAKIIVKAATNTSGMFRNCEGLTNIDLSTSTFENVANAEEMFSNCSALTKINAGTNVRNMPAAAISSSMFAGCINLVGGAGYKYNATHTDGEFARIDYGGMLPGYFTYNGTTPIDYSSISFDFKNNWFNSTTKTKNQITNIKFSTAASDIGNYTEEFVLYTEAGVNYYAHINNNSAIINFVNGIKVKLPADSSGLFSEFTTLSNLSGIDKLDTSLVKNVSGMFKNNATLTSATLPSAFCKDAENMEELFSGCTNLSSITINQAYDKVTNMRRMFASCSNITSIDLSKFDTKNVTDMSHMFNDCNSLTSIDLSKFNTKNVIDMSHMFANCSNITSIDISKFDTKKVRDMSHMFYGCSSLTKTVKPTTTTTSNNMFTNILNKLGIMKDENIFGAGADTIDLTNIDVASVSDMSGMFKNCTSVKEIDLSNFDTKSLTDTSEMFMNATGLETILASDGFDVSAVTNDTDMFTACDSLVGEQGTKYSEALIKDKTYAKIDEGPTSANPGYFTGGTLYLTYLPGDGASGTMPKETMTRDADHPISPVKFTRDGYNFVEWIDQDGNKYSKTGKIVNARKSITLTATWEKKDEPVPPGPTPPTPPTPPGPSPTPTPTPAPSGPSGGGGGGSTRGSGIMQEQDRAINFVMQTPIYENEYTWVYDNQGRRTGINLNVDSTIGKAMLKSVRTKGAYGLNQDGKTMQLGGGGIYKIYYRGKEEWFGFDKYNKMITGFVETSTKTRMLTVATDIVSALVNTESIDEDKIFIETAGQVGKYYLYEQDGDLRGQLWYQPIVVKGIQYTFDLTGKVISSTDTPIDQGIWEYNPLEDHWKYFVPDTDGKARYYTDTAFDVYYKGETYKYIFDESGYLFTGYFTWRGKDYYGLESGQFKGAATEITKR